MKSAEIWLKKAEEDLTTANFNKENNKFSYAAFLYQQSIEKGLKALQLKQGKDLIKIHDCFILAKDVQAPDDIIKKADTISPYYFRTRYPDVILVNISKKEIETIASAANEVLLWIKKKFSSK